MQAAAQCKGPGNKTLSWDTPGTKIVLAGALLVLLVAPSAAAPTTADIVVTTSADATNGDVRTVAGLIANPGPDGLSLREAIQATNNDPGSYTIGFAPPLAGKAITLSFDLPPLTGGGVTVEGDIDGNGKPDVTLRPTVELLQSCCEHSGFQIDSSGNRLHALALQGFGIGVGFQPCCPGPAMFPSHRTVADNVVSGLVIRGVRDGIVFTFYGSECGLPKPDPCPTYNRWANTTLTRNTIETSGFGIHVALNSTIGDRVEGITVTDNAIRVRSPGPSRLGVAIQFDEGGNSTQNRISDVLIARNSIEGVNGQSGIFLGAGLQRAQANTIDGVRILDNRIHLVKQGSAACCVAIVLVAGSDTWALDLRPVKYPSGNVVRDLQVAGNSVSGSLAAGVRIMAGADAGGSRNGVENVRVERNVIRSTMMGKGVYLWVGDIVPFEGTYARGNRITGVKIDANQIATGKSNPLPGETDYRTAGGIVLLGGWHYGRRGVIRDVLITKNRIATAQVGIRLIGGLGSTARGNSVTCVRLAGNRITGTRNAVSVAANVGGCPGSGKCKQPQRASGNRASLGGC